MLSFRLFDRRALASLLLVGLTGSSLAQSVSIAGGAAPVETFDGLAATGTSSDLPVGWYLAESGNNANTTYAADDGSVQSGNSYSYGSTGSSERAFGALLSGSLTPTLGAQLVNASGGTLGSLLVSYVGEQWRIGALGRVDRLDFQYSLDATSLTTGTWINVDTLDFIAPNTTGPLGPLDGNAPANRQSISAEVSGLNLATNAVLWVRWTDFNPAGIDDGLAIDDIRFAVPGDFAPSVMATDPSQNASEVPVGATIGIAFSEPVAVGDPWFTLQCGGTPLIAEFSGGPSAYVITPDADLPFGTACSVTLLAAAVTDLDGDPDPLAADFTLNFTTQADLPPTLASSTPVNNAPAFPTNGSLQLTFSEPVTVGQTWFQIGCSLSGTRVVGDTLVSGGPSTYTLDPSFDFDQTETCTLTLDAAQITDLDGAPQTLSGANTVTFTVGAPVVNQPPTVLSTTPMNGDSNFPAAGDLVVLFSEQVTTLADAFGLSCETSGSVALTYPSTGTSFTIDTGTALVGGESCTFTIVGKRVVDADGAPLGDNVVVTFTVRTSGVGGYYGTVNSSSPEQLRCTLHQTIRGHTEYPYGWDQLEIADEDPLNQNRILDIYRNCSYDKVNSRVGNGGPASTCGAVTNLRYNREHVWPRSLGFNNTGLAAHNDLHMLHLSDETFNANRGNKPFATCTQGSGCIENRTIAYAGQGGGNGTYPGLSNWYTAQDGSTGSYEVWSKVRGNMARAIFYMAIRYEGGDSLPDLELTDERSLIIGRLPSAPIAHMGLLTTLLQWHLDDPVDDRERDRNEVIFNFQSNRNPFVDRPDWATLALFQSTTPAVCVPGTGGGGEPLIFANGFE